MKTLSYFLLLITGVVLVGCATQTPEQRAAKYVAKGDAKMEQAMDELNNRR